MTRETSDLSHTIDVGPGVLGLALLLQDARSNLEELRAELEQGVVGQVLEGELALAHVARVGLAQHGVAEARNDAARVEHVPAGLLDLLVGVRRLANVLHHLGDEAEALLVGEAVERAGEAVHAGGEREVRVRECRADEVHGVRRDVAALVVRVDDEVEAHELLELRRVEAEHVRKVGSPVERLVGADDVARVVLVAVDVRGHERQLGDEVVSQYSPFLTPAL